MSSSRGGKIREIVLVGTSSFAEIAYEYFTFDSEYEVKGFVVDEEYLTSESKFGLPVVPYEQVEKFFDPILTGFHVAIPYPNMNKIREDFIIRMKRKQFRPVSYLSSCSFVWRNVELGEHLFIFEENVIQPFCKIHDNVILWSGNHIGHHSIIEKNVFISSHVVLSGHCRIGCNSFLGVNSTIANNVNIAKFNWIGMDTTIGKDTKDFEIYKSDVSKPSEKDVRGIFLK